MSVRHGLFGIQFALSKHDGRIRSRPGGPRVRASAAKGEGAADQTTNGDQVVYFGDHVELSDNRSDFASTIAVGGLVGSNFVLPELMHGDPKTGDPDPRLTKQREQLYQTWMPVAKKTRLWEGEYLGELYDIALDRPETHAVKKDGSLFYGFFAPAFHGEVELRGLEKGVRYDLANYVDNQSLGSVTGPEAKLNVNFRGSLLLWARPMVVDDGHLLTHQTIDRVDRWWKNLSKIDLARLRHLIF